MNKIWKTLAIAFFFTLSLQAQDQDFSQFYAAPSTLNPALTGAVEGNFRVNFIYRDQWRKVLDNSLSTFSTAADFRFDVFEKVANNHDAIGFGLIFYNDKPGLSYSVNQIVLGGAYHKNLDKAAEQILSLGAQVAIAQRNTNYSLLTFEDQFDGTDNYSDPTQESLPVNNFSYSDFNVGINYAYTPKRGVGFHTGASMFHILEPEISSFYDANNPEDYPSNILYRKYNAYINFTIPLSSYITLSPRALGYLQGPHLAVNGGANVRFLVGEATGTALHLGSWARLARDYNNSINPEAVVVLAGFEYSNFLIGFSYDLGLRDLAQSRKGQGAFEISVAYLGEYDYETVLCPKF